MPDHTLITRSSDIGRAAIEPVSPRQRKSGDTMLKIVKDSVLKVSRSFGYDIVPLREMKERDFALHLRELLARLEIDCVLDVGANAGQ
jgi:hypothetical protein